MDHFDDYRKKYGQIFEKMNLSFDDYFFLLDFYNQFSLIKINKSSHIYHIISKEKDIEYAAKIINQDINKFSKFEKTNYPNSLYIMSKLSHPAILKLIGISPFDFKNKPKAVIVTEICPKGSLYELFKNYSKKSNQDPEWNSTKKLINIFGIASGMKHIHSQNIIHRDLNPKSILLDDKMYPKINNFELSQFLSKSEHFNIDTQIVGDPYYIAPEIFNQKHYSQASDVYSFGFIVYEIMTNKKPFEGINNINKIMIEVVNKNSRPKINGSIPLCYRNLINSCWHKDKNKRPTFDQIVNILKTDPNFITNDVSKSEYLNYVASIDQQENHIKLDANDDFFDLPFTNKLDIHSIEKFGKIGVGNFFTVFKVLENKRFGLIAAKVMNLETNKISKKEIQNQLKKRFLISSALTFPSILEIYGYSPFDFEFKFNPTIFTELADMTLKEVVDLERIGKAPNKWNLTTKLIIIYGIAAGMKFLHSKNIVHRNINMNSILLNNLFHPKIYDFKLSKFVGEITGKIVNFDELNEDSMYIAHEIWSENKEYKSSDVYAFSLIVYEILTKESPTNMPHINSNVPKCF